jgi:hypothetical protein
VTSNAGSGFADARRWPISSAMAMATARAFFGLVVERFVGKGLPTYA